MRIQSFNPTTGELLETFDSSSDVDVDRTVDRASEAFRSWRKKGFKERAKALGAAAGLLRKGAADYARTMALEMGKPITEGMAEVEKCAVTCDFYATHAEAMLAPERHETDAQKSYVRFDPLGVVFAIMPWNFPFWQ